MRFFRWLKSLLNTDITPKKQQEISNTTTNKRTMRKKTVISKVLEEGSQDGVTEFPQNRTLYVDQFTDVAPNTDEAREGFKAKSMKEVFEHFQPSKEGIALSTKEGGTVYEDFLFRQIKDFEDEQLIAQSELLSGEKAKIDAYNSVIRQLEKNKALRNALRDSSTREDLKNAMRAILAELEGADK